MLHIQNEDTANTLNDRTIQHHKQLSRHVKEWLDDPVHIVDNAHEARFVSKHANGLPLVHSKVKRTISPVKMKSEMSRKGPIIDLVSNEIVQLKEVENP